jgi:O-acetylhomoserine (thiol)-lyase
MRDLGSVPSPANSFYLNAHLESLAVRMARHCASAQEVAASLAENSQVSWVRFPGLPSDPYHELAQRYMPRGTCGVISFGVKGGREKVGAFTDSLRLASIATHVADARTCVLYPAGTTHRQMSDEELVAAGVGPDLIRLSVGLEDPADLIADIEQALAQTA